MNDTKLPRLDPPEQIIDYSINQDQWKLLIDVIYPEAKSVETVLMVLAQCKSKGYDVFNKPYHIVPMWSSEKGTMVDTIWPGINQLLITATRTNAWAGIDEPQFGSDITKTFKGFVKGTEQELTVTYPEYCSVTVYRIVSGHKCPFSEIVFWTESYSSIGKSSLPNHIWSKRPKGQLLKCAKAAALRAAFPEECGYAAEEMDGKVLSDFAKDKSVSIDSYDANAISPKVISFVNEVISRASKNALWDQALEFFEQRLKDAQSLAYAKDLLRKAAPDDFKL